jgi:hypothetical protein
MDARTFRDIFNFALVTEALSEPPSTRAGRIVSHYDRGRWWRVRSGIVRLIRGCLCTARGISRAFSECLFRTRLHGGMTISAWVERK